MSRAMSFLEELAETIVRTYSGRLDKLRIVFPNRRAGLFFNRALAQLIDEPVWSPSVMSIEDFILEFSEYTLADRMTLLLDLYEVYCDASPIKESFENFYFWGEMLLRDFDEADKYLVNVNDLFVTLRNLKEIDSRFHFFSEEQKEAMNSFWAATLENPTENKKNFIAFWQSLNPIYRQYEKRLKSAGYGYQGMIYRHVWEKINADQVNWENGQVIFAGFNALTKVEENIIKWVIKEKGGMIHWDLDSWYFDDPAHEAGHFMRKYYQDTDLRQSFPHILPSFFKNSWKEVHTVSASQYAAQVRIAGDIVNGFIEKEPEGNLEDTVIVLPDESLLSLLLHNLPDGVRRFNITMGYPVTNSAFYSLFEHLLELQEKTRRGKEKNWFNHRNVIDILNHPYVTGIDPDKGKEVAAMIHRSNMILVPGSLFDDAPGLRVIFTVVQKPGDLFDYLMNVLVRIRGHMSPGEAAGMLFEKEFALVLYKFFNRLKETFLSRDIELHFSTIRKVIRSYARNEKIPFTGEPLAGLQIMGLLETRNLDFSKVIMIGVNEGLIPGAASQSSFIPHNVRRAFGLPVPENRDAIYSYLFYRLMQRAEKVFLIYNSEDAFNRKAEPSRFIYQLQFESGLPVKHRMLVNDISIQEIPPVVIHKDSYIQKQLERYQSLNGKEGKFLTPSKLSTYLECPLSFCYRYVYDIEEKEEVTEDLDAVKFGRILHNVMENLYKSFTGRMLERDHFRNIRKDMLEAITLGFATYHGFSANSKEFRFEGKNLLGREIIRKYVKKILDYDEYQAPFRILDLEAKYQVALPVKFGDQEKFITLRGVIDRIDTREGTLRIIDYKSGRDLSTFGSIDELFERSGNKKNKAVFQTLLYSLMFLRNYPGHDMPVVSGTYNFKELHSDQFDIRIKLKKGKNAPAPLSDVRPLMEEFQKNLTGLIREIFDPSIPFRHAEETKDCFYCKSLGAPSELWDK